MACLLYSLSPAGGHNHTVIQAKDYISFEHRSLNEGETLEIIFSETSGIAKWASLDGLGQGHDITTANELSNPATFPGVNSIMTAGAVDALLTGGVSMTLSATNSITVNAPISASGSVTSLSLNAPTLFLNESITFPSGGALEGTAMVVNVGPSGIIQNGVDAVASGGIVNLATATYVQEVYIGKDLTLNGNGINNTSIVCPTTPAPLNNTFTFSITGAVYHPIILAEGASTINIQNLTVNGNSQPSNFLNYRFVGIGYHNAGGTIQNNYVTNIEDSFPAGGTQHGFGILGAIDSGPFTIQVLNNKVDHFQKQAPLSVFPREKTDRGACFSYTFPQFSKILLICSSNPGRPQRKWEEELPLIE